MRRATTPKDGAVRAPCSRRQQGSFLLPGRNVGRDTPYPRRRCTVDGYNSEPTTLVAENMLGFTPREIAQTSAPIRQVPLEELRRAEKTSCEYSTGPLFEESWSASIQGRSSRVGQTFPVELRLRNDSNVLWPRPGLGAPEIRISYHWLAATGEIYVTTAPDRFAPHITSGRIHQGDRRGGCTLGARLLHVAVDVAIENVSWFSVQGWGGPMQEITVAPRSPLDQSATTLGSDMSSYRARFPDGLG